MPRFLPDRCWPRHREGPPLAIAHRGASAHAPDNTLAAFELAHELGADMWEVDIRLTADGVPVAFHDADLTGLCADARAAGEVGTDELLRLSAAAGRPTPLFRDVAALAADCGAGIYLDAKEGRAATLAIGILLEHGIERAIVGANTPDYCAGLIARGAPYPVSLLIGRGQDPFALTDRCGAEIVHPCWEKAGARPDRLLDAAFFEKAATRGLPVVTWHEEREAVLAALAAMPVLGICSDTPERVIDARERAQTSRAQTSLPESPS